eukprot:5167166-Pyramimonas_sp.AAC.1
MEFDAAVRVLEDLQQQLGIGRFLHDGVIIVERVLEEVHQLRASEVNFMLEDLPLHPSRQRVRI